MSTIIRIKPKVTRDDLNVAVRLETKKNQCSFLAKIYGSKTHIYKKER